MKLNQMQRATLVTWVVYLTVDFPHFQEYLAHGTCEIVTRINKIFKTFKKRTLSQFTLILNYFSFIYV